MNKGRLEAFSDGVLGAFGPIGLHIKGELEE